MSQEIPIMSFKSHIEGKNAEVSIWPDRIEWAKPGSSAKFAGKMALATLTAGTSLLATGVGGRKAGASSSIPISSISAVTTKRDGLANDLVQVMSSGALAVEFRIGRSEAQKVKDLIIGLVSDRSRPAPPAKVELLPPEGGAQSVADELRKFATLRDEGIMSEEEFAAQKARLLG